MGISPDMDSSKTNKKPSPQEQQSQEMSAASRRRYDSPVRRQQTAATQERIIAAGAELVHGLSAWDLKSITARAVGERAGVSERTVHRYFPTERKLRDAVLQQLVKESGIALDKLSLDEFGDVTARILNYLSSFAVAPITATVADPEFESMDQLRRTTLLGAVAQATPDWSDRDRENAAAVLDILWNLPPYERLVMAWGFDSERAIGAVTWVIDLIKEAIQQGRKPNLTT